MLAKPWDDRREWHVETNNPLLMFHESIKASSCSQRGIGHGDDTAITGHGDQALPTGAKCVQILHTVGFAWLGLDEC